MHLLEAEASYRLYNDGVYEVAITDRKAVVHDRRSNKYYESRTEALPREIVRSARTVTPFFSVKLSMLCTVSMLVLLAFNIAMSMQSESVATPRFFLWFTPYMVASIIIHEGAHVTALRLCGRREDRIGVKMNYFVFPAFYVRMNQTLLLPQPDKVIVHVAGIWVNLTANTCIYLANWAWIRSPDLEHSLAFAALALSANALPVLNSDGYRCLLAWTGFNEHTEIQRNSRWIIGLKILSWMIVLAYGFRFLSNTLGGLNL